MARIGTALKGMMKAHKISAPKLAERSGVPLGSIKSILTGQSQNPRANTLEALAKAFDCEMSDLFQEQPLKTAATPLIVHSAALSVEEEDRLFREAILAVDCIAREKNLDLSQKTDLRSLYIEKVFLFAREAALENNVAAAIDMAYARWLVGKEYL